MTLVFIVIFFKKITTCLFTLPQYHLSVVIEIYVFCAYPNKNKQNVLCQHGEGVHSTLNCALTFVNGGKL